MEKNNVKPIVGAAATGASAAAPIQATVPAFDVADSASAVAPVQAPFGWDPYEQAPYVAPKNPYDTSIVDEEPEAQSSDVDSDDESFHTKAHHVLRRLQSGQYDRYFDRGVSRCPFCNRNLRSTEFNSLVNHDESFGRGVSRCPFCNRHLCSTEFNSLVNHAKSLGNSLPRVGKTVNVHSFMAHHKALGIHMRSLQEIHRRNLEALNGPVALSVCNYAFCRAA